jgi:proline dehydrogenase
MAGNAWLRYHLPRLGFARRAVLRFMPGEDVASALRAGMRFQQDGIAVVFTRLGENITGVPEADEVAEHYLGLIDTISRERLDGEISLKPTQLGLDIDGQRTEAHVERLAARAASFGKTVWIDMEGTAYTERTIALYERVKARYANVGVCLQAYLRRSGDDVQRLLPLDPAIRLVKGAYAEPESLAYQAKHEVDASFVALAIAMLDARKTGAKLRIALGTHDVALVSRIATYAETLGLPRTALEVQMLYGIRTDEQRRLAREGFTVRDLICYGSAWYPWYMRRLAERPANVWFALRQLLP